MSLTNHILKGRVSVHLQKTGAGIGTPLITWRSNRADSVRFFYGFGRSGPLRRAAPRGGSSNFVRPAHPRLEPWQAGVVNVTWRLVMPNQIAQSLCAQTHPEIVDLSRLEDAVHVARQVVERDGPAFLPILKRLEQELLVRNAGGACND